MRRLPVYFLVDVSDSMVGKPLESVQRGLQKALSDLSSDPYALETAFLNVIVFAGKVKKLISMEEVYKCSLPNLEVGTGTCFGAALDFLMNDIDTNLRKTTVNRKGDWRPLVFIITDGASTDDASNSVQQWKSRFKGKLTTVVLALGESADKNLLKELTDDVFTFSELDDSSFKKFFNWVSTSVQASSACIEKDESIRKQVIKAELLDRAGIEKVETQGKVNKPDEHYILLRARCQCKKEDYLIKYKREDLHECYAVDGAYPINGSAYDEMSANNAEKIPVNVDLLQGVVSCPICENRIGWVSCGNCGKLFCASGEGICKCPWCGNASKLKLTSGFEINRSLG